MIVLLKCFCQNQFQLSELWSIPQFKCWNISETTWPMWDSLNPDWDFIQILWLGSKINTLDVSRIKSNQVETTIESNQIKKQLSQIQSETVAST